MTRAELMFHPIGQSVQHMPHGATVQVMGDGAEQAWGVRVSIPASIAMRPHDARLLAQMILAAADEAEARPC